MATTANAIEPDAKWLDLVEQVESSGNANAIGDGGKARGAFQMWQIAWADVSNYRRERDLKVYPYAKAWDYHIARLYAHDYAQLQRIRMMRKTQRDPDAAELYALYNLSYGGFARRGFDLSKCPRVTRQKAGRIAKGWRAKK
jgi:hypothetical protein